MDKKTNNKIESRQVIQYMVDKCQESSGTSDFGKRVTMLRDFICLELPELKSVIHVKEKELKLKAKLKIRELFEDDPNEYFHPFKKMMHDTNINEDFYEDFDVFLNNMINKDN